MKNTRTIVVVVLALICGASAAVGVLSLQGRARPEGETLPVVTAATDLRRGQLLDAKMVKLSQYRKQDVPRGAVTALSEAVGRTVVVPLAAREPLVAGKLTEKGKGLAPLIPDGMRAFTIQTPTAPSDVGGFIMPGNHVDVLLTMSQLGDDGTGGGSTTTLLQNLQVLAVAQTLDTPDDNKPIQNGLKSVTLLVTPDQAAKLDLGMNKGVLHLALRNPIDDREATTRPATVNDLRFRQEKPVNLATWLRGLVGGPVGPASQPAVAATPDKAAKAEAEQAAFLEIQTLRGSEVGLVRIAAPKGEVR